MSRPGLLPLALDILGVCAHIPEPRVSVATIFEEEREIIDAQLAQLTPTFRERLLSNLGIACVSTFGTMSSKEAGCQAAMLAIERSGLSPDRIGLIVDYSTYSADSPGIWSLAHEIQGRIDVPTAWSLGVHGSGCAGLHAAMLVASSMLLSHSDLDAALLVAADRAPSSGRSCLPISLMADAATALVVARVGQHPQALARVHALAMQHNGQFSGLLVVSGDPPRMVVNASTFERKVLPLHFVMLHRVLAQALAQAKLTQPELDGIVYPNTTALDRSGIARGFGFSEAMLLGPGPARLGHAFANDMLINAASLLEQPARETRHHTAWLAAGSGFSWGAAIVEHGLRNVAG